MTTKQPEFIRVEGDNGYLAYIHDKNYSLTKEDVATILQNGGYTGDFEIVSKTKLQSRAISSYPAPKTSTDSTDIITNQVR